MTASSPSSSAQVHGVPLNSLYRSARHHGGQQQQQQQQQQSSCNIQNHSSTSAFQQVKQTQASLARQSHVHQQLQAAVNNNNNNINISNNNHHQAASVGQNQQQQNGHASQASHNNIQSSQQQKPAATFVDCLIRRFKNCFNEDLCTVPMFVVGNLSPGIDGTHLILPPCVSLDRQGINRFSSPKNLRLMNSIRESCRSIEELDLGGNKLTDLIEVYKILQLTPNLRFLNLSENDLSRTAPVAMATSNAACPGASSTASYGLSSACSGSGAVASNVAANNHWTPTANQRSCLAPLNQNTPLGTRRHSTLGQSAAISTRANSSSGGGGGSGNSSVATAAAAAGAGLAKELQVRSASGASRVAEARRLAAANALAQSRKTSSSVASQLANSAAAVAAASASSSNAAGTQSSHHHMRQNQAAHHRQSACSRLQPTGGSSRRHQASPSPSTMHLARSLSSLSAKDIRSSSHHHHHHHHHHHYRNSMKGESRSAASGASSAARHHRSSVTSQLPVPRLDKVTTGQRLAAPADKANRTISSSSSHQILYVEPTIVETDDVDMSSDQQLSPNIGTYESSANETSAVCSPPTTSNNSNQQAHKVTGTNQVASRSYNTPSSSSSLLNCLAAGSSGGGGVNSGSGCTINAGNQVINNNGNISFRRTFESIKALALNNTGCQWRVVCSILSRMPNLEELHLSLNNYEKIDLEPNEFKHHSLRRLYLCNNPKLTNWEELDKLLIAFPSLEALSIANCNISQIPDNLDRAREWRKLCGLNINGWPIKEWPVVERLNQLPSLIDLKCRNLEVLNTIDEPRHHLIARLPKLQRLNGSEIEEREEAEKAFVRFFMANSHLERPSRFHELMQIYGEISTVDVDVDLSPPSQAQVRVIYLDRNYYRKENNDDIIMSEDFLLKLMDNAESGSSSNNVVQQQQEQQLSDTKNTAIGEAAQESTMEITSVSADVADSKAPVRLFKDESQEIVALNVDLRQSVRKFKSHLASLFGLNGQSLILYYIDHEMVGLMGPELLKHNQKKLWNYNVQDGDQFIVEEL